MKPISSTRPARLWASVVAFLAIASYACVSGASQFWFRDMFDGTKDPAWNFYVPVAGPTESFDRPGFWTLDMPTTTQVFDHSSSIDNAAALYLDIPPANQGDDFFIETHLIVEGPTSGYFHGTIVVYFSRYNTFYWGPYIGSYLRVEKSGQNALIDTTYSTDSFSSDLQPVVKLGIARQYSKLTWSVDWSQALAPRPGLGLNPRIAAGVEYRPIKQLPLRAGMAMGGNQGAIYSFGFGAHFGPFNFDLGMSNSGSPIPSHTKGAQLSVGMGLYF